MPIRKRGLRYLLIFAAMLLSLSVSVCASTTKKTVKLKNKTSTVKVSITVGDKLKLTVKDGSTTVTNKAKYTSSKSAVAKVSKKGVVTAKKEGSSVITAKYKKKIVKIKVTVKKKSSNDNTLTKEEQKKYYYELQYKGSAWIKTIDEYIKYYYNYVTDYLEQIRTGQSYARIFRGDMTTSFNVNEPIKFNTMYYVYGRDYKKYLETRLDNHLKKTMLP